MRPKTLLEIAISIALVLVPTFFIYNYLRAFPSFWTAQTFWSLVLGVGWVIVAVGYFNQGWLVSRNRDAREVSLILPVVVFFVQCVLFVKGVYYMDWSLIWGALIVNSGVFFSIYQILKAKKIIRTG